jgi:quercetin dioxygenase-like cupin family protein
MYNGITEPQLNDWVTVIQSKVGTKEGNTAREALEMALNKKPATIGTTAQQQADIIFPEGEKITNNNFTGTAYLQLLVTVDSTNNTQVGNVTFEPGARSNWHLHPGGQILLVTGGTGYYQEKGSVKKIIRKGDVVTCPPNVPHWHGASKDDIFIQLAITSTHKGVTVWLQPVTEQEYNSEIKK